MQNNVVRCNGYSAGVAYDTIVCDLYIVLLIYPFILGVNNCLPNLKDILSMRYWVNCVAAVLA